VPPGSVVWVNNDCEREDRFKEGCGYTEADSLLFRTGVNGRETQVNWYIPGRFVGAALDIQPGKCPNRLNAKRQGKGTPRNDDSMMGGVLHAVLFGGQAFDVTYIDVASLTLEGVPPAKKPVYGDVGTPLETEALCQCHSSETDGIADLSLKFQAREVLAAIQPVSDGESKTLRLMGRLMDGTEFVAIDCVRVETKGHEGPVFTEAGDGQVHLYSALPNPFNPVTRIRYVLPREDFVTLTIYDVAGRRVEQLVAGMQPAGDRTVEWNASRHPSGIYFYRLEVGGFVETRKMILIK
jgi:hypothetical protein